MIVVGAIAAWFFMGDSNETDEGNEETEKPKEPPFPLADWAVQQSDVRELVECRVLDRA